MVSGILNSLSCISDSKAQGPVPRKKVKFYNPEFISQILSKVFLSKNMSLELTKSCFVFTPRLNDDNIILMLD